ncbi:MAG: hypothetical protein WAM60_16200 [Candidatus Promineifilaceae bacterium]
MSEQTVAGWLLILSGVTFLPGGLLYAGRAIWKWSVAQTHSFLYWERGLVMAAVLVATLGLVLLAQLLVGAGDKIFAPLGMALFLISAVVVIVAEAFFLNGTEGSEVPFVVFIVLAFLGQAAFGASILRSGLLPGWVGWATILWNLAWLVILPITRPQNMYYPWLHYIAPLMIGVMLLLRR